mgnify:CR=1 FL=1|tara:strand:+ start:147 stop:389 length:243 start_codon:yes stop_codon:yes gene_type:complete
MENSIQIAIIIAVVFFIIKFIDIKFIKKSDQPLKSILIDSLITFVSTILGLFIMDQFGFVKSMIGGSTDQVQAFVSNPEF